jgi:transposase
MEVIKSPCLSVAPGVIEAALINLKVILAQLHVVEEQRKNIEHQTKEMLETLTQPGENGEHRDAAILLSLPGIGNVVAATMLSEASQALRERDYETMRAQAGVAPVTKRSGKRLLVGMRYACSRKLRNAIYHWSRVSVQVDPVSRQKYAALRAKGHPHGRALRSVADGLLRVMFSMLRNGTIFDLSLRQKTA